MAKEKPIKKSYTIPLADDLKAWEPVVVRAKSAIKLGPPGKKGFLKEAFVVQDDARSPFPAVAEGLLQISEKRLLEDRETVEFKLCVNDAYEKAKDKIAEHKSFLLEVAAELDLDAMKGAMGAAMGMAGLGMLGGIAADAAAKSALWATGCCRIKAEAPVFILTIEKFRWDKIEKMDLVNIVGDDELALLWQQGGILRVPIQANPSQSAIGIDLGISEGLEVCDVKGNLKWAGADIPGEYEPDDTGRRMLIFRIQGKGSAGSGGAPEPPPPPSVPA
jgi:hypothetical protein